MPVDRREQKGVCRYGEERADEVKQGEVGA